MKALNVSLNDDEFVNIISDILANEEFQKLANYTHHNSNRLQHSINVSYDAYKLCKKLNLDYKSVSRAALLHDFFLIDNYAINRRKRLKTLMMHPRYALENSLKYFELSDMEKNIIVTHMFPLGLDVPRYKESILVDLVDDYVAIRESYQAKKNEIGSAVSFLAIFIVNFISTFR